MFRFRFAEFKNFLDTCENAYTAIDEHCITCEGAITQMYDGGFSGYAATAADIKFLNWYESAYNNSASIGLLHTVGKQIKEDMSSLKNTAENIPASIGGPSTIKSEWSDSEIAVEGSAASLPIKAQNICDVELADMESTLSDLSATLFLVQGTAAIQGSIDTMRTYLNEEREKLRTLKGATSDLLLGITEFEGGYDEAFTRFVNNFSLEDPATRSKLFVAMGFPVLQTGFKVRADHLLSLLSQSYADDAQRVLSQAGVIRAGDLIRDGRYVRLRGFQLAQGQAPTRILANGTNSTVGEAIMRADDIRAGRTPVARAASGAVRVGGRITGVASVGLAAYDGYNRSATATDEERVIHAATEGTIAAAGIGVSIGVGAGVGASLGSVVPGIGTAVGLLVGVLWGLGTYALGEIKDENGVSMMEHIDNGAVNLLNAVGQSYSTAYSYGWQSGSPVYLYGA